MNNGVVFNIQKCSIHDGPGIRTLVFLKGCPLRCLWCANPESQNPYPEIASLHRRCIKCGECEKICPQKAIRYENGIYLIDGKLCDNCQQCAEVCYTNSKQVIGKRMSVNEVITEILKDKPFYKKSGGGVTFSGGEPLMQPDFLIELLKECKRFRINTAIETSGHSKLVVLNEVSKYLDTIYFDIKHMDSVKHKELTGVSNDLILKNLKALDLKDKKLIIRIPIIPAYNDSEENLIDTALLCTKIRAVKGIELLPYHNLGEYKYCSINMVYKLTGLRSPESGHIKKLLNIIKPIVKTKGIACSIIDS